MCASSITQYITINDVSLCLAFRGAISPEERDDMTEEHRLISAESVTEGHPDKVCDQISDAILDDLLAQDSSSVSAVTVM